MGSTMKNFNYRRQRVSDPAEMYDATDIFHPHADQRFALGTILDFDDGRRFRYAEDDGTGIAKALMTQAAAIDSNWIDIAQTAAGVVGDMQVTINSALSTALTANILDDGWLWTNDEAGEGDCYKIKTHTTGTTPTIYLADKSGLRTALTASTSEISMIKNQWKDVLVRPAADGTNRPTGVTLVAVTAGYFFWAQTRGPCAMLVDAGDTLVAGDMGCEPATGGTAGSVGTGEDDHTIVRYGYVLDVSAGGEYALIDLCLE